MLETSHSPIGPCALGQLPFGDNFKHVSTARLIPSLLCGENAGEGRGGLGWNNSEIVRHVKVYIVRDRVRARLGFVHVQEFGDMLDKEFHEFVTSIATKARLRPLLDLKNLRA